MAETSVKPQLLNKTPQSIQSYSVGFSVAEPFSCIHIGWKEPLGYVYLKLNILVNK